MKHIFTVITLFLLLLPEKSFAHPAIERFLSLSYMKGSSVSFMVKDIESGSVIHSYDAEREVIPASVMKLVTTAVALEVLGENFRFETAIMYDGQILGNTLHGNLYIRGSGDPTLGSVEMGRNREKVLQQWIKAIKDAGIRNITGAVIADDSMFDTEGVSMKWMREDLGSYYGQGCYGLNIFDNCYSLFVNTGEPGSKPAIDRCVPDIPGLFFRNYLTTADKDSSYIVGIPYSTERYLYGMVPPNRHDYRLRGDIPDPPLFLAQYFTQLLNNEEITVAEPHTCYRILSQEENWQRPERKMIIATLSPPLKELVRITNHVSSNLFADAILKSIGLQYRSDEVMSSYGRGIKVIKEHLESKGIDVSSLWMFDGSGLAATDKMTASFMCELLTYMSTKSTTFFESIPACGIDGTVANFLRGSELQGKARLKSGSMSRVCSYAGYVTKDNKKYAVAIIVNNFSCKQAQMKSDIEQLLIHTLM
jgi:D-alanyl-D-alanine carboxypeptidase, serine-type, PBP4 family